MKTLAAISVVMCTIGSANLAWQFCFEDTTLGGILPFLTISLSPVMAAVCTLASQSDGGS